MNTVYFLGSECLTQSVLQGEWFDSNVLINDLTISYQEFQGESETKKMSITALMSHT